MLEVEGSISWRQIEGHRIGNHLIELGKWFKSNALTLEAVHQAQNEPNTGAI